MSKTKQRDPAITIALEYERAVLDALREIKEGTDGEKQIATCLRFGAALAATHALPPADYNRSMTWSTKRGRIPEGGWQTIQKALETFLAK